MKRIISFTLLILIVSLVAGCSDTGKQAARDIVEEHATDRYEGSTKATKVVDETQAQVFDITNFKSKVDAKGAETVDTKAQIQYNGFTFQIEDLKLGDTIYGVNSMMSQDEANSYCQWLLSGEGNSTAKSDGTFGTKNTQLVFLKCRFKNNSTSSVTLRMAPTVYGLQDGKTWGPGVVMVYGFSGRHELYTDPRIGIAERGTYTFIPGEELDTVFMLGFGQMGNPSSLDFAYTNEGVDIYLSSQFLSNESVGSKLPTGSFLLPIFKGGQLVN